jgi:hypothetical protein
VSDTNTVVYTDASYVIRELNLQQSTTDPTQYYVWLIPTSVDTINQFVLQANEYATALWGDLTSNETSFKLARQYATKLASLRLLQEQALNWQISGMQMGLGNLTISRLNALERALKEVKQRLMEDLNKIYTLLSEVEMHNNYQPRNIYEVTHGSMYWG